VSAAADFRRVMPAAERAEANARRLRAELADATARLSYERRLPRAAPARADGNELVRSLDPARTIPHGSRGSLGRPVTRSTSPCCNPAVEASRVALESGR
jgi:hypothetical protein